MSSEKHRLLAVGGSAILASLAFPPINQWYLAFIALVPLLWVFSSGRHGFLYGYLFGLVYGLFMVHWLAFNSGEAVWIVSLSMVAAALALALNYGLIGWMTTFIFRHRPQYATLAFPFTWMSVEYLRSFGALGFPWIALANSQTENLLFAQLADIGGIWLISFIIVSVNVLLFHILYQANQGRFHRNAAISLVVIFLAAYTYGFIRWQSIDDKGPSAVFRVVQPNYGSSEKWDRENRMRIFHTLDSLSRADKLEKIDFIVWPESATPVYLRKSHRWSAYVSNISNETRSIIITGAPDYEKVGETYYSFNSMLIFEPGQGLTGKYDKEHLVPFGEYIPLSESLPKLKSLNIGIGNFVKGVNDSNQYQRFIDLRLAPIICYESIFPHMTRQRILEGGVFLLLLTNDSWFGDSWAPYQHAAQAKFRAIETRRPLIRSANTGISMAVNIKGQIIDSLPLNTRGVLDLKVQSSHKEPLYLRFGDFFAQAVVLLLIVGVLWLWRKK
ncbi:MAG TPA: apolipoprotein N-acyltransferase [Candidatus Marinimicrobia bacterium]|nr:apolipoprotein N-acyltransferase [Candidatus Neomarinimicrobiota bacterium]